MDHNFSFQAVSEDKPLELSKPNPFYGPEETEPLASCGYRYRLFDLSINQEEDFKLAVRTQVDAYIPGAKAGKESLITLKTLNEFDSRAQGAGGAPDWRAKLDTQRGAVVSTEMKNNSAKLAKWAVQSMLAGAEAMKIGCVICPLVDHWFFFGADIFCAGMFLARTPGRVPDTLFSLLPPFVHPTLRAS